MLSKNNPQSPASGLSPVTAPPSDIRLIMSGLLLVIMLGAIEQTVVAVALPVIAAQLQSFDLMAWVISAYLVACTVATPIYGKLSDVYGRRAVLTSAIVLFVLASAGCALAASMPQLIFFRVLQGLGGGGLISVAQATIGNVVSLRDRGRYQGYISGVFAAASLAGPVIGGFLTQYLSWHWIFLINLPLGLLALVIVRRSLRHLPVAKVRARVDYAGAVLLAIGLTALLLAVNRIGEGTPASEPFNIFLCVAGIVALTAFIWQENHTPEPIIPLALLRNRTVTICSGLLFLAFFQFIALAALLPLRLQLAGGLAPDMAALRLLPLTLAIPIGAFLAGRSMSISGRYKWLQIAGTLAASAGAFGLAFCGPEEGVAMSLTLCMLGVGIGFQLPTSLVASQNAVPPAVLGVTTALSSLARLLGGAIGMAVLSSTLLILLRQALHAGAAGGLAGDAGVTEVFEALQGLAGDANLLLRRDAADMAFRQLFLISASVSLLAPLLTLFLRERPLRGS